jgi:hypothetical protein
MAKVSQQLNPAIQTAHNCEIRPSRTNLTLTKSMGEHVKKGGFKLFFFQPVVACWVDVGDALLFPP